MLNSVKLAQEILTATQPSVSLFINNSNLDFQSLSIISKKILLQSVTHLKVRMQQVYLVKNNIIECCSYEDNNLKGKTIEQTEIVVDGIVKELNLQPQGYLVISKYPHQYCINYRTWNNLNPNQLFRSTNQLITTLNPQGYLILSYLDNDSQKAIFEILSLPKFKILWSGNYPPQLPSQNWNLLPKKLITLDSYYGLAFYSNQEQSQTSLQLFNRRGNWLANFSLGITLDLITPNDASPYRLFALDSHNRKTGLLIDLKPFQVTRIALPIDPAFVISQKQNFILCDRQGNIVIFNTEDRILHQWQLSLEESSQITAIACTAKSELLLATWSQSQGTLYHGNLDYRF